jgi:hypothetical protein
MAKLKIKNLKQVQNKIRRDITKVLRAKEVRIGVGEIVVEHIQTDPVPVKSKATLAWRNYLEEANQTAKEYIPGMINMTFTGALMKDLKKNVKASFTGGKAEYVIEQSDKKHKKYKKPKGGLVKGTAQTFKEIGGHLFKLGYKYLTFSKASKADVLRFIKKEIGRRLK